MKALDELNILVISAWLSAAVLGMAGNPMQAA